MSYIVLTNKESYQTDLTTAGIELVESYDYMFYDKRIANYSIVKVTDNKCKIKIVEESDRSYINHIPVKFFEAFETIEEAREELDVLVGTHTETQKLVKVS
ncbi:hypothetical protein [Ammoniphilus sp. 3BR4]|uniref:hypothetical protein n=1 Tax=Ammoniphilus sp. 3BR4 TaxID=3158265 RepID=UPI003465A89E